MRFITTYASPTTGLRPVGDTSWHRHAACQDLHPEDADELFFPLPRDHDAISEAKALCASCPVRRDCLNSALENGDKDGIWGGLTESDRRPWHDGLPQRLDHQRVLAVFNGRYVHLTSKERDVVIGHAYVRGWSAGRLAVALQISPHRARDLLAHAAYKIDHRDRTLGVPPQPKKRRTKRQQRPQPPTTTPPAAEQRGSRPAQPQSVPVPPARHGSFGKVA